jgi:hypothetical protein
MLTDGAGAGAAAVVVRVAAGVVVAAGFAMAVGVAAGGSIVVGIAAGVATPMDATAVVGDDAGEPEALRDADPFGFSLGRRLADKAAPVWVAGPAVSEGSGAGSAVSCGCPRAA